jgi:DNA replication protein DnaC
MYMNSETIKAQMRELRLKTAASLLEDTIASQRKTVTLDWLGTLLAHELDARKQEAIQSRIRRAEFPEVTALENFDWDFNPDINRDVIERLATLQFVEDHQIALFLGKPGTGKTHLALALGVRAVYKGHRVFCSSVKRLTAQITLAKQRGTLDNLFKKILSARLWILDDWGVISMKSEVAEEVFDLLDKRRLSSALILTSNRDVEEWGSVFPDPIIASAAIDRIFDRATIVSFTGNSYRLRGKIQISTNVNVTQGDAHKITGISEY